MRQSIGPTRRRTEPVVERLETRDLLSVVPPGGRAHPVVRPGRPIAAGDPMMGGGMMGGGPDAMMGQPTPHEQRRRSFFAAFTGRYLVGPGRTLDQVTQTYINGGGTSNTFLHGNVQIGIFTPADPTRGPTGTATLFDKNVAQTSNQLILNLEGDPQAAPDGRVMHLTWTVDSASSGTFAKSDGQGTLEIRYQPGGPIPRRAIGAGRAFVKFRGDLILDGTTNTLLVG